MADHFKHDGSSTLVSDDPKETLPDDSEEILKKQLIAALRKVHGYERPVGRLNRLYERALEQKLLEKNVEIATEVYNTLIETAIRCGAPDKYVFYYKKALEANATNTHTHTMISSDKNNLKINWIKLFNWTQEHTVNQEALTFLEKKWIADNKKKSKQKTAEYQQLSPPPIVLSPSHSVQALPSPDRNVRTPPPNQIYRFFPLPDSKGNGTVLTIFLPPVSKTPVSPPPGRKGLFMPKEEIKLHPHPSNLQKRPLTRSDQRRGRVPMNEATAPSLIAPPRK